MLFKYRVLRYIRKHPKVTKNTLQKKYLSTAEKRAEFGSWCNPDPRYLIVFDNHSDAEDTEDCMCYEITSEGRSYLEAVSREIGLAAIGILAAVIIAIFAGPLGDLPKIFFEVVQDIPLSTPQ